MYGCQRHLGRDTPVNRRLTAEPRATIALVDLFVLDDAVRPKPERQGMGPLVAVGGLYVPSAAVGRLEREIEDVCAEVGFPPGEEFKWSPGRELWMRDALKAAAREQFFRRVLALAALAQAKAIVVVADTSKRKANRDAASPEEDVVTMFLERAQNHLDGTRTEAMILTDRPSGDRQSEVDFLANCLATIRNGTRYVLPRSLTIAVSTQSRLIRLLQLADVVVSSTLAAVAGESRYAPPIFREAVRPILRGGGGVGLKIHPDGRYANLYHWLLDDPYHLKRGGGIELPARGFAYAESPDVP